MTKGNGNGGAGNDGTAQGQPLDLKAGMELIAAEMNALGREVALWKAVAGTLMRKFGVTAPGEELVMTVKDQLLVQGMGLMMRNLPDPDAPGKMSVCVWLDTGETVIERPKQLVTLEEAAQEARTGKPILE